MIRRRVAIAAAVLLLAGCAHKLQHVAGASARPDWRRTITEDDASRLKRWREAIVDGRQSAANAGNAAAVEREGALLEPDSALADATIPPGNYRCRIIKMGAAQPGLLDYVAYPAFDCQVRAEGGMTSLTKMSGSQRPTGMIFADTSWRQVFLGTLILADENRPFAYGQDQLRDMAGAVQRIGAARWRVVFPYPHFESKVDVMELVPAG